MIVSMKNDAGLVRQVKVGFCWTAFFFGALPFFFRGMPSTGFLWCCTLFIGNFVLPFKMNKYTAQYYLEHGYKPYGKGWHKAALAWGVAIPSTGEETTNDAFSDEPESSKYVFKIWHALVAITVIPGILMAMFGSHESKSAKSEPVEQVAHIQPAEPVAPAIIDTPAALDKAVVTQMAEVVSSQNPTAEPLIEVQIAPENLWIGVEPGEIGGSPKIHLAPGILGPSASDVGRIAFSAEARFAVELIGGSCIAATTNGERAYPKGIFPFEGVTDLVASGKWLPFGAQERGVFLVFKLISCTYPFPFTSLRYTSERKTTSSAKPQFGGAGKNSAENYQKRFSKARQDSKLLVDEEPDKAKRTRGLGLFSKTGAQFPDLVRKPVSKVEIDEVPTVLHSLKGVSLISGSSVGDAGKDARIQPIDLVAAANGNIAQMKESNTANTLTTAVFLQLIEKLLGSGRFTSVEIVRLDPRQRFDHLSMMPMIVDEDGEVLPACVVQNPQDSKEKSTKTRHRRISIGRALELYATHYFMIPESLYMDSQLTDPIELHLVTDRSKSIVTHDDLQAAIGAHFSKITAMKTSADLGNGVSSCCFTESSGQSAPLALSEKFNQQFLMTI